MPNSVNIETSLVLTQWDAVKLIRTGYEHEQTFFYVKRIHQNLYSNALSFDYYFNILNWNLQKAQNFYYENEQTFSTQNVFRQLRT